jgi:hypothetical protein
MNMDKQPLVRRRKVDDALGESAGSPSNKVTETSSVFGRESGRRTNASTCASSSFLTLSFRPSPAVTYDFLNRKYGELDSRQANENKQRKVF